MKKLFQGVFLGILVLAAGCRSHPPVVAVNTPQHSYSNGLKFLEKGEYENALAEFERAKAFDPRYASAYVGIALAKAAKGEFEAAFTALAKAKALDGATAAAAAIRILSSQKGEGWLRLAEEEFEAGRRKDPRDPALYFSMGRAYALASMFDKAASMFRMVLILGQGFSDEAIAELIRVERIRWASPSTEVGKGAAFIEQLTRADVAALLVEELKLGERILLPHEADSKPFPPVTDVEEHPFKAQIETVAKLNLRGLEPFPDHTFAPYKPISKANFAILLEDIWIRAKGQRLAVWSFSPPPSFSDVPSNHYAYSAITLLFSERILDAKPNERFNPNEPLSGIEAIWAITQLKGRLGWVR